MQEICSWTTPVVTEICDLNKFRARHNQSQFETWLKVEVYQDMYIIDKDIVESFYK